MTTEIQQTKNIFKGVFGGILAAVAIIVVVAVLAVTLFFANMRNDATDVQRTFDEIGTQLD